MNIALLKERRPYEKRVALTPEGVKKYTEKGFNVFVERGAGERALFLDEAYEASGAHLCKTLEETLKNADILLKIQRPLLKEEGSLDEIALMKKGLILIGMLGGHTFPEAIKAYEKKDILAFSLELIPRISRAQSMDVLSSQSNLGGYQAVIEAVYAYGRIFPMMMTAAGTLFPAKVLILGAGVAGLQAIATARRLGAVVSAFDVREAAREHVESLGAQFISVNGFESGEGGGGYAKEMSIEYQKAQSQLIHETLKKTNVVITTALIPGKKAPVLITEEMIQDMKPGSVILDMAVEMGGNCSLSSLGETVEHKHVKIIGIPNLPSCIPQDASQLYGKNMSAFLDILIPSSKGITSTLDDEILKSSCLTPSCFPFKKDV